MKKVFKSKCNSDKNILSKIIVLTIVLIGLVTFFLITKFNKNMNKNLIEFGESEINRITYRFITDKINNEVLNKTSINDILVITKNKDEILYVDFNLDKAYKVLDNVSDILTSSLDKLEMGDVDVLYLDKDLSHKVNGLILIIPMGSVLNSGYFYNLGPKIPVKINFIGSV